MTTGEKIRSARNKSGMSQTELANHLGISKQLVYKYERDIVKNIPMDILKDIARILDISPSYLADFDDMSVTTFNMDTIPYNPTKRIPILGRISAGLPLYADEHIEGWTYTELNHGGEYFALRVHGDSMNALNINDGYLVIVRRQDYVDNGSIAIVMVGDDEATMKRFYQDGDKVTLMPQSTNPANMPQIYDLKCTPVKVIGKVVEVKFTV